LVLLIVLLFRSCGMKEKLQELEGDWHYDAYTRYEFDGKGNGGMFYGEDKALSYSYKIKGETLCLDFELEYVNDCQYDYSIEGDTLILIGGKGTAEPGREYELTKMK